MRSTLLHIYIHKHQKEKQKETRVAEKKYVRRSIFFILAIGSIITLAAILYGASLIAQYSLNLPSIDIPFQRKLPESTIIYDNAGNQLYTIYDTQNRIYLPLSKIPKDMKMAMLSAEDSNFYQEDGINIPAIVRSFLYNIFERGDNNLQGASTITQQLIKYTTLSSDQTIERKVKEIVMTLKVSQKYSKDAILEAYLNTVPFGGSNYGVEAASYAYFNKDINDLDLAQYAFLAALPQAPGIYSPVFSTNPDALKLVRDRQHYVLDQMLIHKNMTGVTKEEIDAAEDETLVFSPNIQIKYPSFVLYVRSQLYKMYGQDYVNNKGLRVYTTLDSHLQDIADQSVESGVQTILKQGLNAHNASLIALDGTNGNILAMVGSANYADTSKQVDGDVNMTLFPISPGSSVKPFVYITAFENGMDPNTVVQDVKTTFPGNYTPADWDNKTEGDLSITQAILQSRNIPAVEVTNKVGLAKVYNNLLLAGLPLDSINNYGLSLAIGACEIPLLNHTNAYLILSQDGINHPVRSILTIDDKYGNQIYNNTLVMSTQVFDPKYVHEMNDILKNYNTLGPVRAAGYTVAGKTGTGQDNKNNLFMGYSSHLVVGVWSGNTDQSATSPVTFGENTAAPIWNAFMVQALPLFPETNF